MDGNFGGANLCGKSGKALRINVFNIVSYPVQACSDYYDACLSSCTVQPLDLLVTKPLLQVRKTGKLSQDMISHDSNLIVSMGCRSMNFCVWEFA